MEDSVDDEPMMESTYDEPMADTTTVEQPESTTTESLAAEDTERRRGPRTPDGSPTVTDKTDSPTVTEKTDSPESEPLNQLKRRANDVLESVNDALVTCADDRPASKIARITTGNVDSDDLYLLRLLTFARSPGKWSKPRQLSPRVCAAHGWYCSETNILRCSECKAMLHVALPLLDSCTTLAMYNKKIQKYVADLQTHHKERCIWRDNKYREPVDDVDPERISKIYMERYESLEPHMRREFRLAKIAEISEKDVEVFEVKLPKAMILAVCGWSYEGKRDRITCTKCHRITSIFIFHEAKHFDPLDQHYKWCPIFDRARTGQKWKHEFIQVINITPAKKPTSMGSSIVRMKLKMREALGQARDN